MDSMAKKQDDFMQSLLNSESSDSGEDDTTDEDSSASLNNARDDFGLKTVETSVDTQVASASMTLKCKPSAKARLQDCILCQEVCIL